ncbi:InlB B-repeat-containing protein, partial [Candidatus Saccharibacteria bacterium]|nr:InlB B-repeat-containing protein [Candidatus Saccharibacteria bacterium]
MDCGTTGPSTGCNVTLPNGPSSTNEDSYVFAGWADSANATEAQYSAGSSFYIRKDTTLYAVYEVTTLSYQVYGGNTAKSTCRRTVKTGVCQVQLKTYEQMVAEGLPERQGYTFLGWSSTSEATSAQYQPGELYTVAPAASPLYGVWGVKASTFTLNFDANAGSDTVTNMPQTQTYTSSDTTHTFTVPTTRPTRQGYT